MFRQMDLKGQAQADTKLKSTHQNTVHTIRAHEEANGVVSSFSSKISLKITTYEKLTYCYSERCRRSCCYLECLICIKSTNKAKNIYHP